MNALNEVSGFGAALARLDRGFRCSELASLAVTESLIPVVISSNSFISVHCQRSAGRRIASFVGRPLTIGTLLAHACPT